MRVLHVVEPFSSGIITFIIHLVEGMPEFENIVVHGNRVTADKQENVRGRFPSKTKFIEWPSVQRELNILSDLRATFELNKIIRSEKPDVIHLHSSKAGFIGRLIGIFFKASIIYTPNGLPFLRLDIGYVRRKYYTFLEFIASRLSGRVICCSKSESFAIKNIGINNTYINNGTQILRDTESNREPGVITIICAAIITEQKDPELFNSIAEYFAKTDNIKFIWVGDGALRDRLKSKNIFITGWMNHNDVKILLSKSDIYLSCSLWEGLPFAVMEAMNHRTCLLLRRCSGNVDLVHPGINGYIYESLDEAISRIKELIVDRSKINSFGRKSKQILSANFDAKKMAANYASEYLDS